MNKWVQTAISLGSLRAGEKKLFSFESVDDLGDQIKNITPSCPSCTSVIGYKSQEKKLLLEFGTGQFPQHLKLEGKTYYDTSKTVTVEYKDNTSEKLYFTVRIYK